MKTTRMQAKGTAVDSDYIDGYDDNDLDYDAGEGRWSDPDWDDYDDDPIDEWLRSDAPYVRLTLCEKLSEIAHDIAYTLHPNRLRKCPVCHKRGEASWREGLCINCWIPF